MNRFGIWFNDEREDFEPSEEDVRRAVEGFGRISEAVHSYHDARAIASCTRARGGPLRPSRRSMCAGTRWR